MIDEYLNGLFLDNMLLGSAKKECSIPKFSDCFILLLKRNEILGGGSYSEGSAATSNCTHLC